MRISDWSSDVCSSDLTLYCRALRATAVNRRGARLVGISTNMSGSLTFTLAAAIGALSGMLIAPVTTVYYDTGFLIGLKGFVAAIFGGLISYPVAAGGALRSEEHTSELQSLMRISYAVFCLKKKKHRKNRQRRADRSNTIDAIT